MTRCNHEGRNWWIMYDARGIPVGRVCEDCVESKRRQYRSDVLEDPNYWADEPIEEEY